MKFELSMKDCKICKAILDEWEALELEIICVECANYLMTGNEWICSSCYKVVNDEDFYDEEDFCNECAYRVIEGLK